MYESISPNPELRPRVPSPDFRAPTPDSRAPSPRSVRHPVNEIVDPEFVRLVRVVEGTQPTARPFPELRDVGVVVFNHHEALAWIVVLEQPAKHRLTGDVRLWKVVERFDLEERVEDRKRGIERDEPPFGEHALHVALERLQPASPTRIGTAPPESAEPAAPFEVVDDQKAALLQVGAKVGDLLLGHIPPVDLDDVRERVVEQLGIIGSDAVDFIDMRPEIADLVHDPHEILFGDWIAMRPRRQSTVEVPAGKRRVIQPDE